MSDIIVVTGATSGLVTVLQDKGMVWRQVSVRSIADYL